MGVVVYRGFRDYFHNGFMPCSLKRKVAPDRERPHLPSFLHDFANVRHSLLIEPVAFKKQRFELLTPTEDLSQALDALVIDTAYLEADLFYLTFHVRLSTKSIDNKVSSEMLVCCHNANLV
jgi:hypothetical protein